MRVAFFTSRMENPPTPQHHDGPLFTIIEGQSRLCYLAYDLRKDLFELACLSNSLNFDFRLLHRAFRDWPPDINIDSTTLHNHPIQYLCGNTTKAMLSLIDAFERTDDRRRQRLGLPRSTPVSTVHTPTRDVTPDQDLDSSLRSREQTLSRKQRNQQTIERRRLRSRVNESRSIQHGRTGLESSSNAASRVDSTYRDHGRSTNRFDYA